MGSGPTPVGREGGGRGLCSVLMKHSRKEILDDRFAVKDGTRARLGDSRRRY